MSDNSITAAAAAFRRRRRGELAGLRDALSNPSMLRDGEEYPCCRGLDVEDLLSEVDTPLLRALIERLLRYSLLAPLAPASVICSADDVFTQPFVDVETALFRFLTRVGEGLGRQAGPASVRFVLFGFGAGPREARAALRGAHDVAFDAFVDEAESDGLLHLTPHGCRDGGRGSRSSLHVGLRDVAYDGLKAYMTAWMSDPGGRRPERARVLLAAGLTDLLHSRTLRKLPMGLVQLQTFMGAAVRDLRIPFTPLSLSSALGFANRVVMQASDGDDDGG